MGIPENLFHLNANIQATLESEETELLDESVHKYLEAKRMTQSAYRDGLLILSAYEYKEAGKVKFFREKREKRLKKNGN